MKNIICFANRDFGVRIIHDLSERRGIRLKAVVTNDPPHVDLNLDDTSLDASVLTWSEYLSVAGSSLIADQGISALFRHRIPAWALSTFPEGVVNLHPSLLPYGRGSYPATWAIWERTPYGATAHLMKETIDTGPILAQRRVEIDALDTSFDLYNKGLSALWAIYEEGVLPWLSGQAQVFHEQTKRGSTRTHADFRRLASLDTSRMSDEARSRWVRALSTGPADSP